jgi:hypothetical protein
LPAGNYVTTWNVVNQHTASASVAGVQVLIAGTPVPTATINSPPGDAPPASRTEVTGSGKIVHAGGTISVLVQVRRTSGSGNVIPQSATIELRKVF